VKGRFVTLNLWGDHVPLGERLHAAAAALGRLQPDVVFLQEIRAGEGLANTATTLAERLDGKYGVSYAPATRGERGTWGTGSGAGEEGLAILTTHTVSSVVHRELPEARPNERRILLSARVEIAGRGVWCHTTHLHWRLADGVARERQAVAIDDACHELAAGGAEVHVLAGDFNAAPDCDEIRFLRGRHTLAGRRTYWQDAFQVSRPREDGFTWARRNPNIIPWLEPDRRIDYIFVSPERRGAVARVLDARVVLDAPDEDGVWPSDHFAVMAVVELGE
jgi:endonuclease/exonuclease/phosphatase family metal-dependent hydrolase